MAKKQTASIQPPASSRQFTPRQRAERVLRSQGRAIGLLDSLPDALQAELAALYTETGQIAPDAASRVRAIFERFYLEQKATVDAAPAAARESAF